MYFSICEACIFSQGVHFLQNKFSHLRCPFSVDFGLIFGSVISEKDTRHIPNSCSFIFFISVIDYSV